MSGFEQIAAQLAKIGAPLIGAALGGGTGEKIGTVAAEALGKALGVEPTPDAIGPALEKPDAAAQVAGLESGWSAMAKIAEAQAALAGKEIEAGGFAALSRPLISVALTGLWVWGIILLPVANALAGASIPAPPWDALLTVTLSWFAVYNGGHTLKSILGKAAK